MDRSGVNGLAGEAYTSSILRELEARTGREVSASAVYVALRRLEAHRLMKSALRTGEVTGERRVSLVPAIRATRVSPVEVMRNE